MCTECTLVHPIEIHYYLSYLLPQLFIRLLIMGDYSPAEIVNVIKMVVQ